jgi:hypothetical protein
MFAERGVEFLIELAGRVVGNVQERNFLCGSRDEERATQGEEQADESFHFLQ